MDRSPARSPVPFRYVVVGLYAACVVAASVVVPPTGGVASPGPFGVVGVDKWLHAGAYAVMGAGTAYALRTRTRRATVVAVVLVAGVGASVEGVQAFLAYRSFSVADAVANAVGAAVGAVAATRLAGRE